MIRLVIENIILFLLPSVAYFAYVYLRMADQPDPRNRSTDIWDDAPLIWLLLAGAILMLAVTLSFATFKGGAPGQVYVPPHLEDGHVVPGRFK